MCAGGGMAEGSGGSGEGEAHREVVAKLNSFALVALPLRDGRGADAERSNSARPCENAPAP